MKHVFKRSVLAAALILLMLVSGCNGTDKDKSKSPDGRSDSGSENADRVDLVYWSMWNETEKQAIVLKEATAKFMEENKGINIQIQWNGREIKKTLTPALEAGTTIDIWDEDLERVVKNWGKYSLALDEFYDKDMNGTVLNEYIMPSIVKAARDFSTDGKIHAVPYQYMTYTIFYNEKMFSDAGISKAPKTWAEFDEACSKLKKAGFTPITFDDGYGELQFPTLLARIKGVEWCQQLINDETCAMWDDPAVLQAAQMYEDFYKKGYFSPLIESHVYPSAQYEAANEEAAMYLMNGTWFPNEVSDVVGDSFKWGTFAFPAVDGGKDSIYSNTYGAQAFQINKNCKNAEAAFKYISYLVTGDWDKRMSEDTLGAPVGKNINWPEEILGQKELFDNMDKNYPYGCYFLDNMDMSTVMSTNFRELCCGKMTAVEFVNSLKNASKR